MNNEKKLTGCIVTKIEGVKDEKPYKFYTFDVIVDGILCRAYLKEQVSNQLVDKVFGSLPDYEEIK